MRQKKAAPVQDALSILTIDDDPIMTSTLQAYFQRSGYRVDTENDPTRGIQRIREGSYDILLLDFLMTPICGNQVVEQVREFNRDIFIILLTGHKSMAPPIKTIRELDIQGYYEKSDRFDQLELLVESCAKSIGQMRTIRNFRDSLAAIVEDLPRMYQLRSVEQIVDAVLCTVAALLGGGDGFLGLNVARFSPEAATQDLPDQEIIRTLGDGFPVLPSAEARKLILEMDGRRWLKQDDRLYLPIFSEVQNPVGLLGIHLTAEPGRDQLQLVDVYLRQAFSALRNALLHNTVDAKNQELAGAYARMNNSYLEMVSALRLVVDAKDIYTSGHSDRVADYAAALARWMGKDAVYCERLHLAGLFHDIGKLGVPDRILLKDTKLTDAEYEQIKLHPVRGEQILSVVSRFREIVPIVRAHHERWDGAGYPDGLRAGAIPEEARIIAVADSFDAMTSDRRYRGSMCPEQAVAEILRCGGTQFDPAVADAFAALYRAGGVEIPGKSDPNQEAETE